MQTLKLSNSSTSFCINGSTTDLNSMKKKNKKDEKDFINELAGSSDQSAISDWTTVLFKGEIGLQKLMKRLTRFKNPDSRVKRVWSKQSVRMI